MTGEVLIVGLGRVGYGDDAVGPSAARALWERLGSSVRVLADRGAGWDVLLGPCEEGLLVLIDAALSSPQLPPGRTLRLRYPDDAEVLAECGARDTHTMGVGGLLSLARVLGWLPPETWIYVIAGERFEPETGLSPAVAAAMDGLVARIERDVQAWLGSAASALRHAA